jgi:site-specific recombinase XerD
MNIFTILGKQKKNGNCAVYIQIYLHEERILINTKVQADPASFDIKNGRIRGKTKEVNDNNLIIENTRSRVNEILVKYRLQNKDISPKQFRAEFSHPSLDIDFLPWMENEIKAKRNEGIGARRIIKYNTVLNKLCEFREVINFSEIDYFFIQEFRGWCKKEKNNDVNTISGNLAVIKTFTGRAIKKGLIKVDPFTDVKIGSGKVDRIFCTEEELKKLWTLYISWNYSGLEHLKAVLRHFLFMCFTGLRVSDFKALDFNQIVNDMLYFYPIKTRAQKKQVVKVPLCSRSLKLISDEGNKIGNVFTTISEQKMNTNLKEIAKMAEVGKALTNHSGRHTFATLFIQKTSDVATLQRLLGHTRIEDTMVYVHITDFNLKNQMNNFDKGLDFLDLPSENNKILE